MSKSKVIGEENLSFYQSIHLDLFFSLSVNVDEWLKSANSLSPNDIEAGNSWFYSFIVTIFMIYSKGAFDQ